MNLASSIIDHPTPCRRSRRHRDLFCLWFLILASITIGCRTTRHEIVRLPVKHSVESEQLLVLSDVRLGKEHPLVEDLVLLRKEITQELKLPKTDRQVIVYLFENELKYRQYIETKYPGLPPRRAYFVGTPSELAVYTFWGERIQEDLRHEFTHGLLHASLKSVPLWLDEGLAEYFEVTGPQPGTVNKEYVQRLSTSIINNWRPDIKRLERLKEVTQMQRVDYQEAWAWVHYMLHSTPDMKQELLSYLEDLRSSSYPEPLSDRMERLQPSFDDHFLSYVSTLNSFRQLSNAY